MEKKIIFAAQSTGAVKATDVPVIRETKTIISKETLKHLAELEEFIQSTRERFTIVHSWIYAQMIRIWPQTVLLENTGATRKLVTAFNIGIYPEWEYLESPFRKSHFTLVFQGLTENCSSFALDEKIPESHGFYSRAIPRNDTDIYRIEMLVK